MTDDISSSSTSSQRTLRDDVLNAVRFRQPGRTPCFADFTPVKLAEFRRKTGRDDPQHYFGQGHRVVGIQAGFGDAVAAPGSLADADSTFLKIPTRPTGFYHYLEVLPPMAQFESARQVERYEFPDYTSIFDARRFAEAVSAIQNQGFAAVGNARLVFILASYLRGMERLLCDFYENPQFAEVLLDRLTEMSIFKARACARAGVDVLFIYEDVATQRGLLMSPDMWRRWLKPRMQKVIAAARDIRPELPVLYDSDGDVTAILDDLLEIGVNALSPMQPECMNLDTVYQRYNGRLAFWGTIGVQQTMPFGSPAEVTAAVRRSIQTYGRNGGLVIGPAHVISPDIPWDNIVAFFEAVEKYGQGG